MSPYSSNTSSSNPDIQQQYAQQQAEQQRAAQNLPVDAPPEQAPRMVQRNRQQQDAVRDEMDIDTGDDDIRAPKRKREEAGELMEGEDRAPKKIRLDPPPEAGPDVRLVARGDMAVPVPAIPTAPLTTEELEKAIRSDDLETVQHLLETGQIYLKKKLTDAHPLIVAIKCNCVAAIKLLLQAGAHINGCYRDGTTLLMSAV